MISPFSILRQVQETVERIGRPRLPSVAKYGRPAIIERSILIAGEDVGSEHPFEPWVIEAFRGLKHASETGAPFALINCLKYGVPCSVIVTLDEDGDHVTFKPLFVAVTDDMHFEPYPIEKKAA